MSEMQEQKMLQQFNALGIFRCLLLLTVCYLSVKVMHESELLKNSFLSFSVPCESGNYWKCDVSSCVACPQGFYQPQWGQTSCWPCPFNTTTDFEGASSPTECKREHQTNSIACFLFRPHPDPHPDPFSDLLKLTNQKSLILQLYNLNFRAKNPKNLQS